eukprot:scaffold2835_cov259-Pinguiococcus_pyrenoidosus.AAC.3
MAPRLRLLATLLLLGPQGVAGLGELCTASRSKCFWQGRRVSLSSASDKVQALRNACGGAELATPEDDEENAVAYGACGRYALLGFSDFRCEGYWTDLNTDEVRFTDRQREDRSCRPPGIPTGHPTESPSAYPSIYHDDEYYYDYHYDYYDDDATRSPSAQYVNWEPSFSQPDNAGNADFVEFRDDGPGWDDVTTSRNQLVCCQTSTPPPPSPDDFCATSGR